MIVNDITRLDLPGRSSTDLIVKTFDGWLNGILSLDEFKIIMRNKKINNLCKKRYKDED